MTQRWDMTLVATWFVLLLAGLVMVTSAAAGRDEGTTYYFVRHSLYAAVSLLAFATMAAVPLRAWEVIHRPCLLFAFVLCALVFVPGLSVAVKGAQRWIDLGLFRFQPAEAAKLLAIIYLAGHISRTGDDLANRMTTLIKPVLWMAGLLALVLIQPDFGGTVVLSLVMGAMLFLGGARLRNVALLALLGSILLAGLAVVEPYRMVRLLTFIDPWAHQLDGGYQLTQALIGFGRGEYLGMGLGEGVQKLFYLPDAHNDFIYAVIAEELGLVGALAVLALLGFLTVRMFAIGRRAISEQRMFAGLVAYGAGCLIGVQTIINIGVNTGVLPTKGLTLPFISFGGNSLLVCSALVALALRVHYEGQRKDAEGPARATRIGTDWVGRAAGVG